MDEIPEATEKLKRPADFCLRIDGCGNAEITTKFRREHIPYLFKAMGVVDKIFAIDEEDAPSDAALSTPLASEGGTK